MVQIWVGLGTLALTGLAFFWIPASIARLSWISADGFYRGFVVHRDLILLGVFVAAFCFVPVLTSSIYWLRQRWRGAYTCGALLAICGFLCVFLIHFGRWQYGSWDFNTLVETGWRQALGQNPYVDFPTTTPPGFNLGVKFAQALFGVNWDATLYFSAMFACVTFLWLYRLMVGLSVGRPASVGVSFAIECAAMLSGCFWWFNNSTLILAAVFFLSCLVYAKKPGSVEVLVSYVLSLALFSLTKPNIAGMLIAAGLIFLLAVTDHRKRLFGLTLAAAAIGVGVLLANHISIAAMLSNYRAVARGRVGLGGRYGIGLMPPAARYPALFGIGAISIPLLGLAPRVVKQLRQGDRKGIAICLFLLVSLPVALYGLATNSDFPDAECTVLFAAGAVVTFGLRWNGPLMRRVFIAIVCASVAGDLYYGALRVRVYGIGPGRFFEWRDNQHRIDSGYLKNMRVSSTMFEVEREVELAKESNPGPYFFGPRMEFNYAVLRLTPPVQSPILWDPGAAFAESDEGRLIRVWEEHRFQTLIFLKADNPYGIDHIYYSQEFLDAIRRGYLEDGSYPWITVYRRRATGSGEP